MLKFTLSSVALFLLASISAANGYELGLTQAEFESRLHKFITSNDNFKDSETLSFSITEEDTREAIFGDVTILTLDEDNDEDLDTVGVQYPAQRGADVSSESYVARSAIINAAIGNVDKEFRAALNYVKSIPFTRRDGIRIADVNGFRVTNKISARDESHQVLFIQNIYTVDPKKQREKTEK